MKLFIITIAFAVIVISCNSSLSGSYKVAAFGKELGDDSAVRILKKELYDKRIDLRVESTSITSRSLKMRTQVILNRVKDSNLPTYRGGFHVDNRDYDIILRRDTSFIMTVNLSFTDYKPTPTFDNSSTIGVGGNFGKSGSIECYLERIVQ